MLHVHWFIHDSLLLHDTFSCCAAVCNICAVQGTAQKLRLRGVTILPIVGGRIIAYHKVLDISAVPWDLGDLSAQHDILVVEVWKPQQGELLQCPPKAMLRIPVSIAAALLSVTQQAGATQHSAAHPAGSYGSDSIVSGPASHKQPAVLKYIINGRYTSTDKELVTVRRYIYMGGQQVIFSMLVHTSVWNVVAWCAAAHGSGIMAGHVMIQCDKSNMHASQCRHVGNQTDSVLRLKVLASQATGFHTCTLCIAWYAEHALSAYIRAAVTMLCFVHTPTEISCSWS
jgi:hypothetical protein